MSTTNTAKVLGLGDVARCIITNMQEISGHSSTEEFRGEDEEPRVEKALGKIRENDLLALMTYPVFIVSRQASFEEILDRVEILGQKVRMQEGVDFGKGHMMETYRDGGHSMLIGDIRCLSFGVWQNRNPFEVGFQLTLRETCAALIRHPRYVIDGGSLLTSTKCFAKGISMQRPAGTMGIRWISDGRKQHTELFLLEEGEIPNGDVCCLCGSRIDLSLI